MAQRAHAYGRNVSNHQSFPREADSEFEPVEDAKITEWREKLNARFGIGKGNLVVIDEPNT
ncbi:MAG: hypothetical protein ACRBB0_15335 [Pelagimonas sp.]|uniref:hypothetical protein n=1 Tax=Pelagimonas sp. TaxID=2073170 RepID=UPI003D6C2B51